MPFYCRNKKSSGLSSGKSLAFFAVCFVAFGNRRILQDL
jgi:hypothetical protein